MENQASICRRRVVLFPAPFQGHLNPMMQLASILHSRGFAITVLHTHFNSPNPVNYPQFTFKQVLGDVSTEYRAQSSATTYDLLSRIVLLNRNSGDRFRDYLLNLRSESEEPIACLITDSLWHFTQSVADAINLRRFVLRASSSACLLILLMLPILQDKGYFSLSKQDARSEAMVPEFPILKGKDIVRFGKGINTEIRELMSSVIEQTKASSGIIWNSFKELEEQELTTITGEFPIPSFPIGPFPKYIPASSSSLFEQDRSSIPWLDHQAPYSVLYVSFGSVAQLDRNEIWEIAQGLANSKRPFLWVVRPGSIQGSEWIEVLSKGFLESVAKTSHIVKWAPQPEVLAHRAIGAFWTHSGWNSTLESICEGVPMICSPSSTDQPINARYVSDVWKVGVYLENGLERVEIEDAIKRVMVDEEGKEMRERMMNLKEKVDLCLMKGGSSHQSLENLVDYISSI